MSDGGEWDLLSTSHDDFFPAEQCSLRVGAHDEVVALMLSVNSDDARVFDLTDDWERYGPSAHATHLSSLASSEDGAWHFAYVSDHSPRHGVRHTTAVLGREWAPETIDDARSSGPSIAVGAGEIHVCYSVWRHGDESGPEDHLIHATRCLE